MVLLAIIALGIMAFFVLSIFDRDLRDQSIKKARGIFDNLLKRSPPLIDKIITDPLTEQITKFRAGRDTGGIRVENQTGV